jgi:hypothetical protein
MENNEVNHTPQSSKEMLLSVAIGVGLVVLSIYLTYTMHKYIDLGILE